MKKILLFLYLIFVIITFTFAQNRGVTRGAEPAELYLSTHWHAIYYQLDPIFDSCRHKAVCRLTENGKKLAIQYNIDIIAEQYNPPDSIVSPYAILADATSGVVYTTTYYVKDGYSHTSLWVSFDYGKSWIFREENIGSYAYAPANFQGLIYRGGGVGLFKSIDFALTFENIPIPTFIYGVMGELGLDSCEFWNLLGSKPYSFQLVHTNDCRQTHDLLPIDSQFMFGYGFGSPDVYRGGLSGEVYISSWFPDNRYRVSFSADTGHTFRHVYVSDVFHALDDSKPIFMSDREPGVFYIIRHFKVQDTDPWGDHTKICVEYYRDYGEMLVGTYCHDLHKDYGKTCEAVNDLVSEKINEHSILLTWSEPVSSLPVIEYQIYRNEEFLLVTTNTTFLDENLPLGEYEYFVVANYTNDCVSDSSNHVVVNIEVGINEREDKNKIVIYPNPTSGKLLVISYELRIESIDVYDIYGKRLSSHHLITSLSHQQINISHLLAGIYFVKIRTKEGMITKKIVKQ